VNGFMVRRKISMPRKKQIAILGGGPAGSICGERLACNGFDVTIYDEHLAWEKPCGGGLTHKALEAFPFLLTSSAPKKLVNDLELIAADGRLARFSLNSPIVIFSREVLNGVLLDRATNAGCKLIRGRVTRLHIANSRPRVQVAGHWHDTDFAVIAAGARNSFLPSNEPLSPSDLEITYGYYIPGEWNILKIKFVKGLEGYVWAFPRPDHLSVGICGNMARHNSRELKSLLDEFVGAEGLDLRGAKIYSHVLPSPKAKTLRARSIFGEGWALVGDAAAWVDPVTGEGIYYAMKSGEILADCLIAGRVESYPELARISFREELEIAANISHRFYHGNFMGGSVTTRMISFARHSETFRQLLADMFAGSQSYRTLKARLWGQLGITLVETAGSLLRGKHKGSVNAEA
jgi:flavin-dependent dehydrogenase